MNSAQPSTAAASGAAQQPLICITSPATSSSRTASMTSTAASSSSLALDRLDLGHASSYASSSCCSSAASSPATSFALSDVAIAPAPVMAAAAAASSRPKLPRLNTGDRIATMAKPAGAAALPAHLGPSMATTAPSSVIPSSASSASHGDPSTSRPASPINMYAASMHPSRPASSRLAPLNAAEPEAAAFCATTASMYAAASLAHVRHASRPASPASLSRPSSEHLASSVGSTRTLSLAIHPPPGSGSASSSRRPTLNIDPLGTSASSSSSSSSVSSLGLGRCQSCNSLRATRLQGATRDRCGHSPLASPGFTTSPRSHSRSSSASSSHSLEGRPRQGRVRTPPPLHPSDASERSRGRRSPSSNGTESTAPSPLPSAIDAASPWSTVSAQAHCGGSPLGTTTTRAIGANGSSSRQTSPGHLPARLSPGSDSTSVSQRVSKRSALAASEHLDRLRRSFVASPASSPSVATMPEQRFGWGGRPHSRYRSEGDDGPDHQAALETGGEAGPLSSSSSILGSPSARRRSSADHKLSNTHTHLNAYAAPARAHTAAFPPALPALSARPGPPPALNPTAIIPSLLYLGPAPSHPSHWAELRALGVRRVLNVAEEVEVDVPTAHLALGTGRVDAEGATAGNDDDDDDDDEEESHAASQAGLLYKKVGIRDHVEEERVEEMLRLGSAFLHEGIRAQEPTYVHCLAGRSRSPTAIIAYLIRYRGWSFDRAYEYVRELRGGGFVASYGGSGETGSTQGDESGGAIDIDPLVAVRIEASPTRSPPSSTSSFASASYRSPPRRGRYAAESTASQPELGYEASESSAPTTSFPSATDTPARSPAHAGRANHYQDTYANASAAHDQAGTHPSSTASTDALWAAPAAAMAMSALATHSYHASNFAPNIGFVAELRRWAALCEEERERERAGTAEGVGAIGNGETGPSRSNSSGSTASNASSGRPIKGGRQDSTGTSTGTGSGSGTGSTPGPGSSLSSSSATSSSTYEYASTVSRSGSGQWSIRSGRSGSAFGFGSGSGSGSLSSESDEVVHAAGTAMLGDAKDHQLDAPLVYGGGGAVLIGESPSNKTATSTTSETSVLGPLGALLGGVSGGGADVDPIPARTSQRGDASDASPTHVGVNTTTTSEGDGAPTTGSCGSATPVPSPTEPRGVGVGVGVGASAVDHL